MRMVGCKPRHNWLVFLFVITLLGLTGISAWGEDWKFYAQSKDGTMYYYDVTRVTQVSEEVVKFWGKAIPSPEGLKRFVEIDPKFTKLDHVISLIEMNCKERRRRPLWVIFYDRNGVAIEDVEITLDKSDWEIVLPGSVQETILDALCVEGTSK
jgi:hypothetical protein